MDEKQMIEELVKMLDSGMADGVGHINVECDDLRKSDLQAAKYSRPWGARIVPALWPAVSPLCTRDWTILNNDD